MHIEFEMTEADFVAASRLQFRREARSLTWLLCFGNFLLLCGVAVLSIDLLRGDWSVSIRFFNWEQSLWLICVLSFVYFPFKFNNSFRKRYRKDKTLSEPRHVDLNADGVSFKSASESYSVQWPYFTSYDENKRSFILIQQDHRTLFPIPKRELSSDQIIELRALFKTHIPRK